MERSLVLAAALALGGCALGGGRVETLSQAPSFRARTLALAPVRATGARRAELTRALLKRLEAGGVRAVDLQDADSVLAGTVIGIESASDPSVLAEVRRATGADAIVFLVADPSWRSLDLAAIDAVSGEPVLRAALHPTGTEFKSADEAAAAAAEALAGLAAESQRAKSAATDSSDEIPVP